MSLRAQANRRSNGPLAGFKGSAAGLAAIAGSVARNVDFLGCAAAVLVINALNRVALHLQTALGCLKQVGERSALFLIEACAAGVVGLNGFAAVYQDGALTAIIIGVMHAIPSLENAFYIS